MRDNDTNERPDIEPDPRNQQNQREAREFSSAEEFFAAMFNQATSFAKDSQITITEALLMAGWSAAFAISLAADHLGRIGGALGGTARALNRIADLQATKEQHIVELQQAALELGEVARGPDPVEHKDRRR